MRENLGTRLVFVFGLMIFMFGCEKTGEIEEREKPVLLNSFSMIVNKQIWQPSTINNDSCYATYSCEFFAVDNIPFYKILAFRDSQSKTDYTSENVFSFQIGNVQDVGEYYITDTYEKDFAAYASFVKNESDNQKIYANSLTQISAKVIIEEMLPNEFSSLKGIKGSFSGVLYNIEDPNDSITIEDCTFTFKKTNWRNFCHCSE